MLKRDQTDNYETTMVSAEENLQVVKKAAGCFTIQSISYPRRMPVFIDGFFFSIVIPCHLSFTVRHLASVNTQVNFKVIYYSV